MTATTGVSSRNERSYSSASATRYSPCPRRAFVPRMWTWPPTTIVGSKPASVRTMPVRDVVVVLPWVPATATPCFRRMISPSISARRITGMPRARAAATSAFDSRDRRGDHQQVRVFDVGGVVSEPRSSPRASRDAPCSPTGRGRSPRSRAASPAGGSRRCRSSRRPRRPRNGGGAGAGTSLASLGSNTSLASSFAASGFAEGLRLQAHRTSCSRSSSFSVIAPARFSAVRLCSSMGAAAPL